MDEGYDALVAQLSSNSNLLDSIKLFIQDVAARVDAARTAGAQAKDALLASLSSDLKAKDDDIAAALVAGTPAAPVTPPSTTPV